MARKAFTFTFGGEFILESESELNAKVTSQRFLDAITELLDEYDYYIMRLDFDMESPYPYYDDDE